MSILKGIKLKDDSTVHQLDYEQGIANKPKIVKSWNDLEDKPFHDDLDAREIIVEKTTLTMSLNNDKYYISNPEPILKGLRFVENDKFIYIWDDVEYECTTKYEVDEQGIGLYSIGNSKVNKADGEDTGEPFFIACLVSSDKTSKVYNVVSINEVGTVEVQANVKTIKYLDSKYIKDMYYTDDSVVEILPLQDIALVYEADGYGYECPLNYTDIPIGSTLNVKWDGVDYFCEVFDMGAIFGGGIVVPVIGNIGLALGEGDDGFPFIMIFDTSGLLSGIEPFIEIIELATVPDESVPTITKEIGIYQEGGTIHQIPSKYIKDMYHVKGMKKEDLQPSASIGQFKLNSTVGAYNYNVIPANFKLNAGETYYIEWDEIEFTMTGIAYMSADGFQCVGMGNELLFGGENNGIPFGIVYNIDLKYLHYFSLDTEPDHVVRISHDVEDIEKIPSKYVDGYTKEETENLIANAITKALNTEV